MTKLTIIIISYNTKNLLKKCINSIEKFCKSTNSKLVIVDNASTDGSVAYLKKIGKRKNISIILNKQNLGFAGANNLGINKANSEYVLLLNSDTYFKNKFLGELTDWMDKNPLAGISSCGLSNQDGSIQATGGYFPSLFKVATWMLFIDDIPYLNNLIKPFHPHSPKNPIYKGDHQYTKKKQLDWVTGAFFLMRKKMINEIGLFDENYFMYTEETDYCYRAKKAGWQVWFLPTWSIVHLGGASGNQERSFQLEYKGVKRFYKKHYPRWQYPLLLVFLKLGSLVRIFVFSILLDRKTAMIYQKLLLYD